MMGEVNAVPFGQRHWPWSDHGPAADADARATGIGPFVYVTLLTTVEMEAAGEGRRVGVRVLDSTFIYSIDSYTL